ncbi:Telomere length regulation protein tel2, partial [Globisporangium splendens]
MVNAHGGRRHDAVQQLRAYIDALKREIRAAEQRYDIQDAAAKLQQLARPLSEPKAFPADWKEIYADVFYRDVAAFVLGFVAINLEPGFSDEQRQTAMAPFFDVAHVPASKVIDVLATTLSTTKLARSIDASGRGRRVDVETGDDIAAADAHVTIAQCVHYLETAVHAGAVDGIVCEMLAQEVRMARLSMESYAGNLLCVPTHRVFRKQLSTGETWWSSSRLSRTWAHCQSACASLFATDLVYNRRQRDTPSVFKPREYFPALTQTLFSTLIRFYDTKVAQKQPSQRSSSNVPPVSFVFRMITSKLMRIGQVAVLIQSWLRPETRVYDRQMEYVHRLLLQSLPESGHEPFLLQLAREPPTKLDASAMNTRAPKYRLLVLLPVELARNAQFQYVVAHKVLLKQAFEDLLFVRVLVDVLAREGDTQEDSQGRTTRSASPLSTIFDVVLTRWSQTEFAGTADYALNASICFFLRYAMKTFLVTPAKAAAFVERDWVAKLCKGVQDHMNHSLERTRRLGMRIGETLSLILSPDNLLNFEIEEEDPLETYCKISMETVTAADTEGVFDLDEMVATLHGVDDAVSEAAVGHMSLPFGTTKRGTKKLKHKKQAVAFDPDELVGSDDEDTGSGGTDDDEEEDEGSDSDSDMSLEAYDLDDPEDDLSAKRPVYLKDLIAGLHAEDDREKTEAALREAETLLRKRPRDLHENATAVVTALLRLEDKYSTSNFIQLRANALATACAVSPLQTIPYFQSQALEREQLLQSRIDVLQAMVTASQELSEIGAFRPPRAANMKSLGQQEVGRLDDDLDARTTRELKTRRWGYRREPVVEAKKNAFAEYALQFFSPLLFGYMDYVRTHAADKKAMQVSDIESVFLAHLLHALASFVECAGHAPQAIPMAKCLLEFAWHQRTSSVAAIRRQVIFCMSRVLIVVPPFLLRQDFGDSVMDMAAWLQLVQRQDPDEGCREGSRLLLASNAIPTLALP